MPSSKEQLAYQEIARRMFKKDPAGEKVESELVGQIDFWDEKKGFGFIRTHQDERYYCHGSAFLTHCGVKDIVKFDVWENFHTESQKAINVKAHLPASTVIATSEIGTIARWFGLSKRIIIEGADGQKYQSSQDDFEQGLLPLGARVSFDIVADNWTGYRRAVAIRSAKIVRHVHQSRVEGEVVKLGHSFGFVSTEFCDKDLYFNGRELTRVLMQSITCHSRIICDVMMEEDGSLTAENIWPCALAIGNVGKVALREDDCASTSTKAATDVPEATSEPLAPEKRKLLKKLREIDALEGRRDLDSLQQAKVAMKKEFQKQLESLTA